MNVGDNVVSNKGGLILKLVAVADRYGMVSNEKIVILETLDGRGVIVKTLGMLKYQFVKFNGDISGRMQHTQAGQFKAHDNGQDNQGIHGKSVAGDETSDARGAPADGHPWRTEDLRRRLGRPPTRYAKRRLEEIEQEHRIERHTAVGISTGNILPLSRSTHDSSTSTSLPILQSKGRADSDAAVLPEVQSAARGCSPR